MKCENCGKNEVTFIYQSNINGKVTEKHLCSQCAEELGYARELTARSRQFHDRLNHGFFGRSLLDDFFAPVPSLWGHMDRMLENPFDDFFAEMPVLGAGKPDAAQEKKQEEQLVDGAERDGFVRMRQLNALRMEQKNAIAQENFERAAELRDEIRRLESEGGQRL